MIESDGRPTIASRRSDPLLERALARDGHLADDVARVLLEDEKRDEQPCTCTMACIPQGLAEGQRCRQQERD